MFLSIAELCFLTLCTRSEANSQTPEALSLGNHIVIFQFKLEGDFGLLDACRLRIAVTLATVITKTQTNQR